MSLFTYVSFDGSTRQIIKADDSAKWVVFVINDFGDIETTFHNGPIEANDFINETKATCASLGFDAHFIVRALKKASKADAVRYAA